MGYEVNDMTEERHECKTYAEMLAVLREAKEAGHTAWWNSEELRNGELIVYVRKDRKEEKNG
jgi:hypothetical protein